MTEPRLIMAGVQKRFGQTVALAGVDLRLQAGEVHAIVGENGAGKSTLMNVMSGVFPPDAGTMTFEGKAFVPRTPREARRSGIVMVHQESTLCPHLTVEENVLLGVEESRFGVLDRRENRRRVQQALETLDHVEIDPALPVNELGPGARQLVEIARGFVLDVRVLVLDEPTSALTQSDAARLFHLIRRLRDRGVTIVYISHFLEEVESISDRLTVLRDGRSVASDRMAEMNRDRIVHLMVGRDLSEQYPQIPHQIGAPLLELRHLSGQRAPVDVDLTLHRGEIVGIGGIIGAGRTELLRAIFALEPVRNGQVVIRGVDSPARSPSQRIRDGVGLLSEDRKSEGLALDQSILDNLTYSRIRPFARFGLLDRTRWRAAAQTWLDRLHVRYSDMDQSVGDLSGGNQQKVAIGRLLHQEADVLLLDEPTKGVDVGSRAEIYRLIGTLAAQGKAILMISSYLPELFGICDRIGVMCRGRLVAIRPTEQWQPEQIMALATGAIYQSSPAS